MKNQRKITSILAAAVFSVFAMASVSQAVAADAASPAAAVKASNLSLLSRDNTVLVLVDHQVGLFTGVRDIPVADLKHNVVALAKAAKLMGIPIVMTATMPDGMWGPTIPELTAVLPDVPVISRTVINAWDDPKVRDAIKKTGRKQILIAGVSLEVCAAFPALSATAAGYDARVVLDASGTFNEAKRVAGLQRLTVAGVPVTDYASAGVELLRDNTDPKAHDVYTALDIPFATLVWQVTNAVSKQK